MDTLWGIVASAGHAIEQVFVYVESHHWIFGFLGLGYISTCRTEAFMPASTRSTSGSMRSESAWPLNIDGGISVPLDGSSRAHHARRASPIPNSGSHGVTGRRITAAALPARSH
jgi:hypothetical protein